MTEQLTPVLKDVFEAYILDLDLTIKENEITMHSTSYYKNNELIAYKEKSSWSDTIIYKVKNPLHRTNPKDTLYFKNN